MKLNYLFCGIIFIFSVISCRPKDRTIEVVGRRPILTVNLINMSEIEQSTFQYRLGGCLDIDGKIYTGKQEVTFEDRKLKKGLGGCLIDVTDPTRKEDFEFDISPPIFWRSKQFSISRDVSGRLTANAEMEKFYSEKTITDGKHYNLQVPFGLPKESIIEKVSFSGTLTCSKPLESETLNDVILREDRTGMLEFKNLKMPEDDDLTITCTKLEVLGVLDGKNIKFSAELDKHNSFNPLKDQTMRLQAGDGRYLLELVSSDLDKPAREDSSLNVEIKGSCPTATPWLHPTEYKCIPCPDGSTYKSDLQRCVCSDEKKPLMNVEKKVCEAN